MKQLLFLIVLTASLLQASSQNLQRNVQHYVDSFYAANPAAIGFLVHVEAPAQHISFSYAVGSSDTSAHKKLVASQPVLIASNTKPYVAATILRLVEQHKLTIDEPMKKLVSERSEHLLSDAGYDTKKITIKHLLSHTSGIRDYVDEDYFKFIGEHKKYNWTRNKQIERAARQGKPLANPGDTFRYADINYLLLTEVIETITKKPFYSSIREQLQFMEQQLNNTWFIKLEETPKNTLIRSHQYWNEFGFDTYDLDPSWDLYGGGGMVSTIKDMAMFFRALFEGRIIHDKKVLAMMYTDVPPDLQTNYCLGIRKVNVAGLPAYNHGGGLGTDVVYIPKLKATIAVASIEASKRPLALQIRDQIAKELSQLSP